MLSRGTFKILKYIITLGYCIKILSWKWCKRTNLLVYVTKKEKRQQQHVVGWTIFARCFVILYTILTIRIVDVPHQEIITCLGLDACLCFTCVILCVQRSNTGSLELKNMINAILVFNKYHMKFHGIKLSQIKSKEDRTVKMFFVLLGICVIYLLTFGPAFYLVLQCDWTTLWLTRIIEFPGKNLLITIAVLGFGLIDGYTGICTVVILHIYANCIVDWMGRNKCRGTETTRKVKDKLRILARGHQILHANVEAYSYYLAPFFIAIDLLVASAALYIAITMHSEVDGISFFSCGLLLGISIPATKIACAMANRGTANSMVYSNSLRSLDSNPNYTKLDSKVHKSIRPIVWRIGACVISHRSLFLVLVDLTIGIVINLILWTRKSKN